MENTEQVTTATMTTVCECEHVDHFESEDCHAYGAEIDIEDMTEVKTDWGTFKVCVACRENHISDDVLHGMY